jgi:hypothetical protein
LDTCAHALLVRCSGSADTASTLFERFVNMSACVDRFRASMIALVFSVIALAIALPMLATTVRNWAVVTAAGSKLQDVPLADLSKLCKGTQKAWPDGKSFVLVMKDPESPEMRVAVEKLLGVEPAEAKAAIAKLNETHALVKIVANDAELLHTVEATPGAVGVVDVYAINSSVKVLRIDGKLPFDIGYALKVN